jgi:2-dehydro-3-deoxy-D-pentonate aldolase
VANKANFELPFRGIVPPLVTPFTDAGKFDRTSFVDLIERTVDAGAHGLFLLGTTGEFASLSFEGRCEVVSEGCGAVQKRVPVIANVSDTSLETSLRLSESSKASGADAVALCPPYYFSLTQEDIYLYARRFAEQSALPVFLYNIPQNAHQEFSVETVTRLAEVTNVIGIKNSNGRIEYVSALAAIKKRRPNFSLLVGNEELMLPAMRAGADGCVCGGANLFPSLFVQLFEAISSGSFEEAERLQELVSKIAEMIYTVGAPSTSYLRGMKAALAELGICKNALAEPLHPFESSDLEELRTRLREMLPAIG